MVNSTWHFLFYHTLALRILFFVLRQTMKIGPGGPLNGKVLHVGLTMDYKVAVFFNTKAYLLNCVMCH